MLLANGFADNTQWDILDGRELCSFFDWKPAKTSNPNESSCLRRPSMEFYRQVGHGSPRTLSGYFGSRRSILTGCELSSFWTANKHEILIHTKVHICVEFYGRLRSWFAEKLAQTQHCPELTDNVAVTMMAIRQSFQLGMDGKVVCDCSRATGMFMLPIVLPRCKQNKTKRLLFAPLPSQQRKQQQQVRKATRCQG